MAYTQTMSPQVIHHHYREVHAPVTPPNQRRLAQKLRFFTDLSQCLFDFVIQLLPTTEELAVKEDVRRLLERLIRTIEPDSRLLSFGSTANGFSLRNSDMDLCCLIDSKERLSATDLVTMLGDLLERETKFHVKPLPHARIPIVKLSLDPSPGLPLGIACDIGFENRLALENTRLLMCYAMIDPTRVRTMVLFLKVWSKRRKINSPYKGTLSSYGYVLLVIYFLVHVKNPPVLPNLQQMPPLRPISKEETHLGGYNTWFFDDIELLRQRWHSENVETVAELLIDFFRYYSRDFSYNTGVASIRAGLLKKDTKGWQNNLSSGGFNDLRERNRLCIEDPFEVDYNVARCVTKDGLYTIRGEFMRAARVLASRPERAIVALAELCEERKEEDLISAPPYVAPKVSAPPPQTPYTVGSQSMRPKGASQGERLSPPTKFFEPGPRQFVPQVSNRPPPEHMAPKRGKWTSPPPAEAPSVDHTLFENQLDMGLELATSSTEAREKEAAYNSSSSNSEFLTDEDRSDTAESDDVTSVRSFTEGANQISSGGLRRPSWYTQDTVVRVPQSALNSPIAVGRGRHPRIPDKHFETSPIPPLRQTHEVFPSSSRSEYSPRLIPGPLRRGPSWPYNSPLGVSVPLPPSPDSPLDPNFTEPSTVFYQTTVPRSPRPNVLYPNPGSHSSILSQYQSHQYRNLNSVPPDIFPANLPPSLTSMNPRVHAGLTDRSSTGPETPTPASYSSMHSHSHTLSSTTITAPTPPPNVSKFSPTIHNSSALNPTVHQSRSRSHLRSRSPSPAHGQFVVSHNGASSPQPSATSNGSSPAPSSATSSSRSPSPHSPSPPPTAIPIKGKENMGYSPSFTTAKIHGGSPEPPPGVPAGISEVSLESRSPNVNT
ncbi:hypothetical protein BDZ94DRAFT_1246261 [Collybia nuda]|uniref:polynucleotide adenylyltransferase n=1 Tax=Collybia nuda TaxID=64659 RepID=A0A9P5YG03_9AGAR|nr:hypothetical protein BDZ94DRAFT_1246261 [Collybia nuda]